MTVSNRCGSFTHNIDVTIEDCSCTPFVPDAFTPNNDGINDTFQAYSNCLSGNYELRIFDRWGNLLFTSNDINEGWDGIFNGQKMSIGIYIYQVTFEATNNGGELIRKVRSGDFTLIR